MTGAAPSIAEHPIGILAKLRFRVTVNTDNRLMSQIWMSCEMELLVDAFGWTLADLQRVTVNAMKSAFVPFDERLAIIEQIVNLATQPFSEHSRPSMNDSLTYCRSYRDSDCQNRVALSPLDSFDDVVMNSTLEGPSCERNKCN